MKSKPRNSPDAELVKVFEAAGVAEYLEYLKSGKRVMWVNFKAGVARGLGMTIGMTVILAGIVWILTMLVDLPVVGEYFEEAKTFVTEYAENTDYKEEFGEMVQSLHEINENISEVIAEPGPQQPQ